MVVALILLLPSVLSPHPLTPLCSVALTLSPPPNPSFCSHLSSHSCSCLSPHSCSCLSPQSCSRFLPLSLLAISFHSLIYLCSSALSTRFQLSSYPTMVATTRPKNKLKHPAAPVMTPAEKEKAGIKTKRRPKKVTKDETIRELLARLAALENPIDEPFSKDPLVFPTHQPCTHCTLTQTQFLKGSSPPLDDDNDDPRLWNPRSQRSSTLMKTVLSGKSEPHVVGHRNNLCIILCKYSPPEIR